MRRVHSLLLLILTCGSALAEPPTEAGGPDASSKTNTLNETMRVFLQDSCVTCHDEGTETRLDLTQLGDDLRQPNDFQTWVMILDRSSGNAPE